MKILILCFTVLFNFKAVTQSPGLTINVIMDSVKADGTRYKIDMKICKPKKMTERGGWFSHDTSAIDFAALKINDIECSEYFDKGLGEPLTYNKSEIPFNKFQFSGQVFAWEEIYVFRISDWSSRGWNPEMYIVLPVKYKSFITLIELSGIEYHEGKVVFLKDHKAVYDQSKLFITHSFENEKGSDVKDFPLKFILEKR